MFGKGQWVVLPYSVECELMKLRLISLGLKDERDRQLQRLEDYIFSN